MSFQIKALNEKNEAITLKVDRFPDQCPTCKKHIDAKLLGASLYGHNFRPLFVCFVCPVEQCRSIFVATYRVSVSPASDSFSCSLASTTPLFFSTETSFPKSITAVSPEFSEIYNQALRAEQNGLLQICGPGFRKALEFIIKDYVLSKCGDDDKKKEAIKKTLLGSCIEQYIDDVRVKEVAKRAAWLGNDETHYYRKWDDKDLQDLKSLISMTVNWIDLVSTSEQYLREMPDGSPKTA